MVVRVILKYQGRRLKKKMRAANARTTMAAVRATNTTGRWARTRVRREITDLLNITQKKLRATEIRATRRKLSYEYRVYRRQYPLRDLKGVRFRPYTGQTRSEASVAAVGVLRFKAYGKQQVFERVLRRQGARGVSYTLLGDDSRRATRVHGPWVKSDYEGPKTVKRQIRRRFRREFRRQRELLAQRARAR